MNITHLSFLSAAVLTSCRDKVECDATELNQLQETCLSYGGSFTGEGTSTDSTNCDLEGEGSPTGGSGSADCTIYGSGSCAITCDFDQTTTDTDEDSGESSDTDTSKDSGESSDTDTKEPVCRSMVFDGTDDYILLGDSSDLLGVTNTVTIAAWIYIDPLAPDAKDNIFSGEWTSGTEADRNSGYAMAISAEGLLDASFATTKTGTGDGGGPLWSSTSVPVGEWVHTAAVRDQSEVWLFINGGLALYASTSGAQDIGYFGGSYDHDSYTIGAASPSGTSRFMHFQGSIYSVAIWNIALSEEHIGSVYSGSPEDISNGLAGYWVLSEEAEVVADRSTGEHDGLAYGTPQWSKDCP